MRSPARAKQKPGDLPECCQQFWTPRAKGVRAAVGIVFRKDPVACLSRFAQEKGDGFWFLDSSKLLCVVSVVLRAFVVIAFRGRFTTETQRVHREAQRGSP